MKQSRYHTFLQRVGAAFADGFILFVFYWLIELITGYNIAGTPNADIIFIVYSIYLHGRYGQTAGKMALHVKVVDNADETKCIGYYRAALREIGLIVSFILSIVFKPMLLSLDMYTPIAFILSFGWTTAELVTMLFNDKRRAIHDFIAGSVVINTAKPSEWEQKYYYAKK